MRTENVSNDTLKSTTIKSSFQNIGLGNQLFNVGSSSQSFDQILSQQNAGQASANRAQPRDEVDSASKKATSQAQSGKTLPADDRRQRLDDHQDKLALQDKQRQRSAEQQDRADAAAERKDADTSRQAEPLKASEDKTAAPVGDAESATGEEAGDDHAVDGNAVATDSKTSDDDVAESVRLESEAAGLEPVALAPSALESAAEEDAVVAVETTEASADIEIGAEAKPATVANSAGDHDAAETKTKEDKLVTDAAALIEEVLAAAPVTELSNEGEPAVDDATATTFASSSAAMSPMMAQADAVKQVTADQTTAETEAATATQLTDKNSQFQSALSPNPNAGDQPADTSSAALEDAADAASDLLNSAGEKLTDALDPLKMEPGKANKNAVNSEQITTPVQERLAALAKSMEKPAKEASSSLQRKTADSIDSVKGSSFQRNVDQFSRLQASAAKPLSTSIATPMNQKEWAGEMGQRLMMMVSSKIQSAQIQVTPGDMGPIDVKVSMQKDQAHVVFTSHVPQTREALEQALPKLREMMDQNGVAMGNADVRDQGTHQSSQRHGQEQQQGHSGTQENSVASTDSATETVAVQQLGVVDFYA